VTQSNQIQVKLSNYRASDSNLRYKWSISPDVNSDFIRYSVDRSVLMIEANALEPKTSYDISVQIQT